MPTIFGIGLISHLANDGLSRHWTIAIWLPHYCCPTKLLAAVSVDCVELLWLQAASSTGPSRLRWVTAAAGCCSRYASSYRGDLIQCSSVCQNQSRP